MVLTYENWDENKCVFDDQADYFEVIKWAFQEYQEEIVYACSFGAEGMVLIDLISKVNPKANIIFLDTSLHFPETYELIEQVKKHYPSLQVLMSKPKLSLENQEKWYGKDLWKENPNLCCNIRKGLPLKEALKERKAWISGLRREQSDSRRTIQYVHKDDKFHKIKICPLIHWTWNEIMTYIQLNNLPYNPLHDQGYPSIGCVTCTIPVLEKEDFRAGRWAGHTKTECGLHQT